MIRSILSGLMSGSVGPGFGFADGIRRQPLSGLALAAAKTSAADSVQKEGAGRGQDVMMIFRHSRLIRCTIHGYVIDRWPVRDNAKRTLGNGSSNGGASH
jgi:hypothetical protein